MRVDARRRRPHEHRVGAPAARWPATAHAGAARAGGCAGAASLREVALLPRGAGRRPDRAVPVLLDPAHLAAVGLRRRPGRRRAQRPDPRAPQRQRLQRGLQPAGLPDAARQQRDRRRRHDGDHDRRRGARRLRARAAADPRRRGDPRVHPRRRLLPRARDGRPAVPRAAQPRLPRQHLPADHRLPRLHAADRDLPAAQLLHADPEGSRGGGARRRRDSARRAAPGRDPGRGPGHVHARRSSRSSSPGTTSRSRFRSSRRPATSRRRSRSSTSARASSRCSTTASTPRS